MFKRLLLTAVLLLVCLGLFADPYLSALKQEVSSGLLDEPVFDQAALDWIKSLKSNPRRPKVAVVLSGGGARGLAHIGLLEILERAGVPIDLVVGTSMGALVGALYSAGYSPGDIADLVNESNIMAKFTRPVISPLSIDMPQPWVFSKVNIATLHFSEDKISDTTGLINDALLMEMFHDILSRIPDDCSFLTDLAIPFACNAADLTTGRERVFTSGSLVDAMRASMSIPIAFTPYEIDGELLIDGGFVNNLGVDIAKYLGADIVIAQNTNDGSVSVSDVSSMSQIVDLMMNMVSSAPLKRQMPAVDLYINPGTADLSILDYSNPDPIIAMGREAGLAALSQLVKIAQESGRETVQDPNRKGSYFSLPEIDRKSLPAPEDSKQGRELSAVYISMFGSSAIGARGSSSFFAFLPQITAGIDLVSFPATYWNALLELSINDAIITRTQLSGKTFDLEDGWAGKLELGGQFAFGSLSPISSAANTKSYNSLDWGGKFWAAFFIQRRWPSMFYEQNPSGMRLRGALALDAVFLNQPFDIPLTTADLSELVVLPYIGIEAVISDIYPSIFASNGGYRADGRLLLGVGNSGFAYFLGLKGQYSMALGKAGLLGLDILAATNRMPRNITEYYVDIGTLNAVPGYWSRSLYDDALLVGASWQMTLSNTYLPLYLKVVTRLGFSSADSAFDNLVIPQRPSLAPFASLGRFVGGVGLSLGTTFALCDVAIGAGLSFSGQFCLYLEAW